MTKRLTTTTITCYKVCYHNLIFNSQETYTQEFLQVYYITDDVNSEISV